MQHEDRTVVSQQASFSIGSVSVSGVGRSKRDRLARLLSGPVVPPTAPRILPDEERSEPKGMLRELAEVSDLLAEHQLVTLVGGAGAGKSALARGLARAQRERFDDGTFHCDVSQVTTLRDLLVAVAEALSLGPVPTATADAIGYVDAALAGRGRTLIVIDGFDDLSLLAADTLERWINGVPELTLLVTAREPLAVPDEQVFHVERTLAVSVLCRGAA